MSGVPREMQGQVREDLSSGPEAEGHRQAGEISGSAVRPQDAVTYQPLSRARVIRTTTRANLSAQCFT